MADIQGDPGFLRDLDNLLHGRDQVIPLTSNVTGQRASERCGCANQLLHFSPGGIAFRLVHDAHGKARGSSLKPFTDIGFCLIHLRSGKRTFPISPDRCLQRPCRKQAAHMKRKLPFPQFLQIIAKSFNGHILRRNTETRLDKIINIPSVLFRCRNRRQTTVSSNDRRKALSHLQSAEFRIIQGIDITVSVGIDKARRHDKPRRVHDFRCGRFRSACLRPGHFHPVRFRALCHRLDESILYKHIFPERRTAASIIDQSIFYQCSHTSIPLAATTS